MQRTRSFDMDGQTPEYVRSLEGEVVHVPTTSAGLYAGTLHWRVSNVQIDGDTWSAVFTDVGDEDLSADELAIARQVRAEHAREALAAA